MIITIDTNEQTVEVLNEDTKDWEPEYLQSIQYTASGSELATYNLEIALPYGIR